MFSFGVAVSAGAADGGPKVAITGEVIQGTALPGSEAVCKGIAFAQSQVGQLRWRQPMPVKPWTGVREALTCGGAKCATSSAIG
ncbi:MAG: carboxylesterase family protein [Candidatus Solibacter sp.]|nr:carboxylesterase family protein [Candidatus Solibacter sp.]